jgi:glucokinase
MTEPASCRLLAFDLGGSRLKSGIVDRAHDTVSFFSACDTGVDAHTALENVARIGRSLLTRASCDRTALCVPGLIEDDGRIRALPGKLDGIVGRNLRDWLTEQFGLDALVVNDAVAFGVGEACAGAARGIDRAVVVTLGTGVGVSVVQDGRPIGRGALGGGILGGQIPISEDPTSPADTNGKRGTIEALCRASTIVARANAEGGRYTSVPAVYAAHAAADPAALQGVERYRHDLARALVALAHAHAPDVIVLGGGPMVDSNPILPGLQALVDESLWPGYATEVVPATLGDRAALLGLAHSAPPSDRSDEPRSRS